MTTKWSVPREWDGQTVAVLASGPSMSMEVAESVRGRCRVIAVNNQGIDVCIGKVKHPAVAPWADVLYAADAKWWMHYASAALAFKGLKVTVRNTVPFEEVLSLELSTNFPFDNRPTHICTGGNSGYQAVHLAAQFGASKILLCGFDMQTVNGKKHWFGDHNAPLNSNQRYRVWTHNFDLLAPVLKGLRVRVINCTPGSVLRCFERMTIEEALQ